LADNISRRARFVATLSSLAAIYGAILTYRLIGFQADAISDILKFTALVFILSLISTYIWWTLLSRKLSGIKLGVLAGGLTAITLIPLPTFIGGFKSSHNAYSDIFGAVIAAGQYSLSTLSMAEFITIPLSMAVGIWASRN